MSNLRGVERITVTKVTTCEGEGVEGNLVREVRWYYADDGTLLFKNDPWPNWPLCRDGSKVHDMQGQESCPTCDFRPKVMAPLTEGMGRSVSTAHRPDYDRCCGLCGRPTFCLPERYQDAAGEPYCSKEHHDAHKRGAVAIMGLGDKVAGYAERPKESE